MKTKTNLILSVTMVILLLSGTQLKAQDETQPITAEEKSAIVKELSKLLNDNYVFPEVALQMEKHITTKLAKGAFDKISKKTEFAKTMTDELQSVSHDKHL